MVFVFPWPIFLFPGDGWIAAWQWEAVNEFLVLSDLHARLSLSLLRCLYLNPWVLSPLAFWFSPPFTQGKWVSGCEGLSCRLGLNCANHRSGKGCGPTARKKEEKISCQVHRGKKRGKCGWKGTLVDSCFSLNTEDASSFKIVNEAADPIALKLVVVHNIEINTYLSL